MKIMPVAFSIFFFFPAGLVLYWLINNILSIAQQWYIKRAMEHAKPAHGKNEIIAAVATPPTRGIGVVRVSGLQLKPCCARW